MKKKNNVEANINQEEKPQSKGGQIVNTVVNVILVIAIVLAALCTYVSFVSTSGNGVPSILGFEIFSIQTDSMYPALEPGDLIIDRVVREPADLKVGDIITYWTVINGERVLNTHRINQIYDGGGYRIFETIGDANQIADPLTVHESEVVGVYMTRVPGLGKAFDYLQTSTGFLIVIVLPVFLFFLYHLIQFFRVLFEYQNVKNRIKYEEERGTAEDLIQKKDLEMQLAREKERAAMEAELRAKLRAELLAEVGATKAAVESVLQQEPAKVEETPVEEAPVEEAPAEEIPMEEAPAEEIPMEEAPVEEAPAEEIPVEEAPAEEPAEEETTEA